MVAGSLVDSATNLEDEYRPPVGDAITVGRLVSME
jgi:hypothetical protein